MDHALTVDQTGEWPATIHHDLNPRTVVFSRSDDRAASKREAVRTGPKFAVPQDQPSTVAPEIGTGAAPQRPDNQPMPITRLVTTRTPSPARMLVVQPTRRDRLQPLRPRLTRML